MSYSGVVIALRPGRGEWRELLLETGRGLMLFLVGAEAPWTFEAGAKVTVDHNQLGEVTSVEVVGAIPRGPDAGRGSTGADGGLDAPGDSVVHGDSRRGVGASPATVKRGRNKVDQGRLF